MSIDPFVVGHLGKGQRNCVKKIACPFAYTFLSSVITLRQNVSRFRWKKKPTVSARSRRSLRIGESRKPRCGQECLIKFLEIFRARQARAENSREPLRISGFDDRRRRMIATGRDGAMRPTRMRFKMVRTIQNSTSQWYPRLKSTKPNREYH